MLFINRGKDLQIRIEEKAGYKWELVKTGETIELPEQIGIKHGLSKMEITEGKIGSTKVETKQFKDLDFFNELIKIKGIGKKTAEDIIEVFKTKEILLEAVESPLRFPFRDDIEIILRREYGK